MKKKYTTADNPHKGNVGFKRLWLAACNSWSGFKFAWREESAFRQELFLLAVSIPVIFILNLNYVERFLLISSLFIVLITELMNSGLEATIDRISFENHDLSKRAKDFGSAAVMLSLFIYVICWIFILNNYF